MRQAAALTLVAMLVAAGCGGDDASPEPSSPSPKVEDPGPIHVHGLGVNPKDGALFIATHTGLFRAPEGAQTAKRVADRYQDTMGFTVVGPDRFLGSGHPDAREGLPPFLGLIRSTDAGRNWDEVSLMGKSDFHVLEASGDRVYGFGTNYETGQAEFLVSDDGGERWDQRTAPGPLISLAISPGDRDLIVGAAEDGLYRSADAGRTWRPLSDDTGLLAWAQTDVLALVDVAGEVATSGDQGQSWQAVGTVSGEPAAFEAAGDDLYAALHDGTIKQSTDGGKGWTVRSTPQATATE